MTLILWGLTALFFLRVVAQLVQWLAPVDFLPAFDQFHGAVLPYPVLLASQLLLLGLLVFLNGRVRSGWRPGETAAPWLLGIGAVYFSIMLFRFGAGAFDWISHAWFQRPIPAFFHLVLATYVITLGFLARRSIPR